MRILAGEAPYGMAASKPATAVHYGICPGRKITSRATKTVQERVNARSALDAVPQVRNLLGAFLFSAEDVERGCACFLAAKMPSRLARMMLRTINLLLLDDPTNNLDINCREALAHALEDFPGTIIIVSHDRFFLDSLATRILALDQGRATVYDGNYSQYLWARQCRELNGEIPADTVADDGRPVSDKKQQARENNRLQKQLNNRLQKLKREIEEAETLVRPA